MNRSIYLPNGQSSFRWLILCLFIFTGCQPNDNPEPFAQSQHSNRVVAVSYPLQFLTQRIAGPEIEVEFPAGASNDPKAWSPRTEDIARMQESDLIIANGPGADYAQWLVRVSLPESKVCNTSDNIKLDEFVAVKDYRTVHSHGPDGQHSHSFMVGYTWLDPAIAKKQADKIAGALANVYKDKAAQFQSNLQELHSELDGLSQQLKEISESDDKTVLSANPNLKFLTRAAGFRDIHLLWFELPNEADFDPAEKAFESRTKDIDAKTMLLTEKPNNRLIQLLKSKSITPRVINSLDHRPEVGDYLTVMSDNIQQLKKVK